MTKQQQVVFIFTTVSKSGFLSMCRAGEQERKSQPPPVVAVVTEASEGCHRCPGSSGAV